MQGPIFISVMALFVLIGLGMLGFSIRNLIYSQKPRAWPTVQGKVVSSEIRTKSASDSTTHEVRVTYKYQVAGLEYEGKRLAYGYGGSSNRNSHELILKKLKEAKTVSVRYDPAKPSEAVLSFGMTNGTLFLLVFGVIWTTFITGFIFIAQMSKQGEVGILNTLIISK